MNQQDDAIILNMGSTQARLYLEDCVQGMQRRLAPGSVDVVVTSPPYNIGVDYNIYDDRMSRDQYLDWTAAWIESLEKVLAEEGSFFLNISGKPTDPWVPFQVAAVVRRWFKLQNTIHWIKSIAILKEDVGSYPGITKDVVVGHYKPINSKGFVNDAHEYIFHFTRTGRVPLDRLAIGVPYQDQSNIGRWGSATEHRVHCRGNTWFVPYKTILRRDRERPHPATFPPKLAAMCIRLHGLARCRTVMDPFLGLGSTALAGVELGVPQVIGFEIDRDYLSWAADALKQKSEEKPLRQQRMDFS